MEIFNTLLSLCEQTPLVTGGFPLSMQGPVMQSFDVFYVISLKKLFGI